MPADLDGRATVAFAQVLMQLSICESMPHDRSMRDHAADQLRRLADMVDAGAIVNVRRCESFVRELRQASVF